MRELRLEDDAFVELAAEILQQGGSFQFRAHGASMAPFVRDGDLLTVAACEPAALRVGEIALLRTDRDRIIAHRVVGKSVEDGDWMLDTRGDARLASDGPAPGDRVLGRIVRVQRGGRTYRPDRGALRVAALLWMRLLPMRRVLARLVFGIKGTALRMLNGLQSLAAYRRLARRAVGARARIGPAGAAGANALARLLGQDRLPGMQRPVGALAREVAERGGLALLAKAGGRPAGGIAVHRFPSDNPLHPGWWVLGPAVRARYRRAGIGRKLLRQAMEGAAGRGATWVYLLAREDDTATRSLAQEVGFLPATLPALQARLADPTWPDARRWVILGCALKP